MGLKVAKSLRQTPVLVERHHLVGAPDAVEDGHVAGIRSSLGTHARSRDNYVAARSQSRRNIARFKGS